MIKRFIGLGALIVIFSGCTTAPKQVIQPQVTTKQKEPSAIKNKKHFTYVPLSYLFWIKRDQHTAQVKAYKDFLQQQGATFIAPDHQFLRSARNWRTCHADEYSVPEPSLWPNMVPTLKLLSTLNNQGLLQDFELTSSYRSPQLNNCAQGAKASSHMKNAALDFRLGPPFPTFNQQADIASRKLKLCKFWQTEGKKYNMGLGIYSSGQIHIDTLGFRTWGPDLSWRSSLCAEKIP